MKDITIYKYKWWIYVISIFINLLICLVYDHFAHPSVVAMGIMLFLLPLFCMQLLVTIVGCIFKNNVIITYICIILCLLLLVVSIYYAFNLK
jgi:hypothetical protein